MAGGNDEVEIDIDVSATGEETINSLVRLLDRLKLAQMAVNDSMKQIDLVTSPVGTSAAKDKAALEGMKARGRRSKK